MADETRYSPEDRAKKILERRTASMDYYRQVDDEIVEVRQALKCKVDPIFKKDSNGKDTTVEDKSRTNVCMPGLSIMARKNVARLTANAPEIDYISVQNPQIGEKLSSWGRMQYDVTNEAEVIRKHVMQAEAFGFSVVKLFQNDVRVRRPVRVRTVNATREQVMRGRGASDAEVKESVDAYGTELTAEEKVDALAEFGDKFTYVDVTTKYSGPTTKFIFIGDFHPEPGCASIDTADWHVEDFEETPQWFEFWADKTYKHPETGEEIPILDTKAVEEIADSDDSFSQSDRKTLRERFRSISNLDSDSASLNFRKLSCRKKFQFHECHERREDGLLWIVWVCKGKQVGEMPYPNDFNGEYQYTELVFFPDLADVYGDSTPRLARFLHRLHNQNVGARTDYINNTLRPFTFVRRGAEVADEAIQRNWGQELQVDNIDRDVKVEQPPQLPPAAWEQEAAILRQMAMLEPSLLSADLAGTNANPQTGKTATVGVLAQRERDALLQFKIDGLNIFWKKHQQKKLWMLQQTLEDSITIPPRYLPSQQPAQNSDGGAAAPVNTPIPPGAVKPVAIEMAGGQAQAVTLNWEEIQVDIDAQPRAGSTLSKEDEFHAMRAQQFFAMAASNPDVFDKRYAAETLAATVKDVDVQKAVPPPTPQPPEIRTQNNLNWPMDKIAIISPELFNQLVQTAGFQPVDDVKHAAMIDGIKNIGEAADAAGKLAEPAGQDNLRKTGADRVGGVGSGPAGAGQQGRQPSA